MNTSVIDRVNYPENLISNCDKSDVLNKKKKDQMITWLRKRTSSLNYGFLLEKDHPEDKKKIPRANKNQCIINALNDHSCWRWMKSLTNADYFDHFNRIETYFYEGNGRSKEPETIFSLDIDCKDGIGSLEGAIEFANHLEENYFPNLYKEVSTEGNGIHGHIVLKKQREHPYQINLHLKILEQHLKTLAKDFDISGVEIKGTLPEITWNENGKVSNYKGGWMCRLPQEWARFEELKNTTSITFYQLRELNKVLKSDEIVLHGASKSSGEGSFEQKYFRVDELAKLEDDGVYRTVARKLLKNHKIKTTNETIVTEEDVAIFLMLFRFFTNNMNDDQSLPTKRFINMWNSLKDEGDITRSWSPNRYSAIRNFLSSLNLINWIDENYDKGFFTDKGKFIAGFASKWKASDELMGMFFEAEKIQETGNNNLCYRSIQSFIQKLNQSPLSDTIKPVKQFVIPIFNYNSEEIIQKFNIKTLVA